MYRETRLLLSAGVATCVVVFATMVLGGDGFNVTARANRSLEDLIRCVEANEEKLSLIKMDFRTDFSSQGEAPDYPRRHPGAGGRLPERRYQEVQWAQDGIRQRFVHSFFNQNGLRICQINVVDGETCKVGDWPELKRGTIRDVSGYSRWMVNYAARLSYRPFYHPDEGAPLLSELLSAAELLSDVSLQQLNGRNAFVLDIRSGPLGCRRLYIDGERGVMVRWELYLGTPDSAGAKLLQCLESTRFHQTENGGWLPVEGRTTNYDDGYTQFQDVRVDVNSISLDRADIPDSLFHLEYPEHTIVSNTILGIGGLQRQVDNIATGLLEETGAEAGEMASDSTLTERANTTSSDGAADAQGSAPVTNVAEEEKPSARSTSHPGLGRGGAVRLLSLFLLAAGATTACLLLIRKVSV